MGSQELTPKRISESRVVMSMVMNPEHANAMGNVHGGVVMKLMDEAAGLAAIRHARSVAVTVAVDQMSFDEPVYVGNVVTLTAELTYTGRTSMEVRVSVMSEDPIQGTMTATNTAYLVFVAIDAQGRPRPVPGLILETAEERLRFEQAQERQAERKKHMQREQVLRQHSQSQQAGNDT